MTESPDNDLAQLSAQLSTLSGAPMSPQLRAQLVALARGMAALGRAVEAPDDDPSTRARIADELDRARAAMVEAMRIAAPEIARQPELAAQVRGGPVSPLARALELVATWLRTPTPQTTAAVEQVVAALRVLPGVDESVWPDQAAQAKLDAELDADVQKSLDELAADMPKFEL